MSLNDMKCHGPEGRAGSLIPEPGSSDLSARRCWATAQPTDSGTRRLGRGPTPPPWVKVARQVGTLWPWSDRTGTAGWFVDSPYQRSWTEDSSLRSEP